MDCIKMDNIKMMSDELLKHILREKNLSIEKKIAILKIIMDESKEDETRFKVEDSICYIDSDGNKFWRNKKGEYHRIDGPAIEYVDGSKFWYKNGKFHREDGPACEYLDGTKYWNLNGKIHRTDGPAVEYSDGTKEWYLNGKRHRTDGPATESPNGTKNWYLNGQQLTEQEHRKIVQKWKDYQF